MTLQENLQKLQIISSLKDNWNGEGASAFDVELIKKVGSILPVLAKQPEIFPTSVGSIQLEYDGSNDSYLEMEISNSKTIEVFRIDREGGEENFNIENNIKSLNDLINSFYRPLNPFNQN